MRSYFCGTLHCRHQPSHCKKFEWGCRLASCSRAKRLHFCFFLLLARASFSRLPQDVLPCSGKSPKDSMSHLHCCIRGPRRASSSQPSLPYSQLALRLSHCWSIGRAISAIQERESSAGKQCRDGTCALASCRGVRFCKRLSLETELQETASVV